MLQGKGKIDRVAYFNDFPHGGTLKAGGVWVRSGDFKLLRWLGNPIKHELCKLRDDLSEANDLTAKMLEKMKELDALIDGFFRDTQTAPPKPNLDCKPGN